MNSSFSFSVLRSRAGFPLLASAALVVLTGCVVEQPVHAHAAVMVEPAVEAVVVAVPPPAIREEVIVAQPSPAHVWIGGYWAWHAGAHVWMAGHWELPPRANCVWVAPRWEQREHGYVFVAGAWRDREVVVHERVAVAPALNVRLNFIAIAPPPPRHEVVVEVSRPSPEHVWIGGYWAWRGSAHVWIAGHWERPPHRHAVWVEPRWEHHPEGYVFIEGRWR